MLINVKTAIFHVFIHNCSKIDKKPKKRIFYCNNIDYTFDGFLSQYANSFDFATTVFFGTRWS